MSHLLISVGAENEKEELKMGNLVSGRTLGDKLKDMLGLPKHTVGFELRCHIKEIVTVKCEYYPEIDGVEQALPIIKEYYLFEKDNGGEKC